MRSGELNLITDVPGLRVGHATDERSQSGVTTLLGDRPLRELGLVRKHDSLKEALELVRFQVSRLARKT